LAINEKTLGPDHPYVAVGLSNLARLYQEMGRDDEAKKSLDGLIFEAVPMLTYKVGQPCLE